MKIIRKIRRIINQILIIVLNRILCIVPLKEDRVLFISDVREKIGGNLEYMYNIIPDDKYKKIVCTKPDRRLKRKFTEKLKLIYNLSTAKYIFLEDYAKVTSYMRVRKNQELIQLWHGPGAFKKFAHSRSVKNNGDLKKIHSGYKRYTKAITSSEAIRGCYAEAFSISIDKVKATGFPRTDLFFDKKEIDIRKDSIYKKYPFLKGKKVILFAPTYRGTKVVDANYDFDKLDLNKIYKEFNKDYVFVFKWHPALYNNILFKEVKGYDITQYQDFYYDLSNERDINDLLLVTDFLITDYSSVIFDYSLLNRPIVYFTYDLEEYENGRGLYFEFKEYVYGDVARNCDELIKSIKNNNMAYELRNKFLNKFMSACDGRSTEKTYKWIFENDINKEKNYDKN